jgi:hypothetical protein
MLIAALALALHTGAADAPPGSQDNPFQIPRAGGSVEIDGDLQEIAWRDALMVTLDYEVRPRDNAPANVRTEVYFTFDDSNLYVGFRCHDPQPAQVRAFLRDRDTLGGDDWVAIEIDTYNGRGDTVLIIGAAEQPTRLWILWGESPHAVSCSIQTAGISGMRGGNEP